MSRCVYCQERSGIVSQVCRDCRTLIKGMKTLDADFGYRTLLDTLLATDIDPDKIEKFLDADPDGKGSLNQRITARMTNQLMGDLGQETHLSAQHVKNVEEKMAAGESYLDIPDVVTHPKAEKDE